MVLIEKTKYTHVLRQTEIFFVLVVFLGTKEMMQKTLFTSTG